MFRRACSAWWWHTQTIKKKAQTKVLYLASLDITAYAGLCYIKVKNLSICFCYYTIHKLLYHHKECFGIIWLVNVRKIKGTLRIENVLFCWSKYVTTPQIWCENLSLLWLSDHPEKVTNCNTIHIEFTEKCLKNISYGPQRKKTCHQGLANNTGAYQLAHPRSLISAFVIRFLQSSICKLATSEISIF